MYSWLRWVFDFWMKTTPSPCGFPKVFNGGKVTGLKLDGEEPEHVVGAADGDPVVVVPQVVLVSQKLAYLSQTVLVWRFL